MISSDPSVLEFDMEGRVLRRLKAVREAGIGEIVNGEPLPLKGKLKVLGKFSEVRFVKWLKRERLATAERLEFLRSATPIESFRDGTVSYTETW